jgi:tetratricopeptide (TPR) repeat protein
MKQFKLPHYSRLFSANLFTAFVWTGAWSLLLFIFGYNYLLRFHQIILDPFRIAVMQNPVSPTAHQNLARLYYINGYTAEAKRESILILDGISKQPKTKPVYLNVLGESTPKSDLLNEWQQESLRQLSIYMYWKSVSIDKPDYISAKIAAAASSAMLGKFDEAKRLLKESERLDPTNPDIITLYSEIGKK